MILVLLLLLPILELFVFVQVAGSLGFLNAVFGAIAATFVGIWLVKQQGLGVLRRANEKVARGDAPTDELVNGTLLLVAGILLLTPGFVTGAVGLLLLLPPVRALLRGSLRRRFASGPIVIGHTSRLGGVFGPKGGFPGGGFPPTRRGDVLDADSWEEPPTGPDRPELP
jgi:UPF0716 protein FxsA